MCWALGFFRSIAKRDDGHDGFVARNAEKLSQLVGITHAHDERVESHGPGFQDKIAVAQAVVVCSPAITDLIGLFVLEET